ncbi:autophagy-related protein 9-like [Bidens hawaiensis]|uniref:autophagy-related protein 9-like n=1 Tax=Bidens hawaiensis TaxID=980011 RepID=UPI00404A75B6
MMFGGEKHGTFLNTLKQKIFGESSLSKRLLSDVAHEIELSDYQKAPSHDSETESPSGLLNGEHLKAEPIADLDLFFGRVYSYYCGKGLQCIVIKWIVELLTLGFIILFSGFFLLFFNWNGIRNVKCGMDAVESGKKPCDLAKEVLHQHPLTPLTFLKVVILGYLGITSIYWIFCFLRFFAQLKDILHIREFYINSLNVEDNEIHTTPWSTILEKVVQVQESRRLCVIKDLSCHDIIMRMMRRENYLIGMLNKGVLAFPISQWVPGAGLTSKKGPNGTRSRLMLTKTLEWTLSWCILQNMFDRNFCIRRDFVTDSKNLKKTLMVVGFAMLLLSPCLVVFMLVYLFLRHAEQFYKDPSTASSRRWSNLSKWVLRDFNEVDHLFKQRINSSVAPASDYLKQFPSPILSIIAKFISFVSGGFTAVLIIIAFIEESLLEGHIFGRNLLWYGAVFGAITAISRAAVSDELLVVDPHGTMSLLSQHTHFMPKRWRAKENEFVRMEFETLFQYTGKMLLEEMASIFLTPYMLIFVVPKWTNDILQFVRDFTVNVEGVGDVCSFSLFDFKNHGNSKYASPHNSSSISRSSQGKMEKSFLRFHGSYPLWEPNVDGKQFLSTLMKFQAQRSPNQMQVNLDHKDHPYIHDCYYISHQYNHRPKDVETLVSVEDEPVTNTWAPPDIESNQDQFDDNWRIPIDDRINNNLEASTSRTVIQHFDFRNLSQSTRSYWWARRGGSPVARTSVGPEASFLEPPNFQDNNYYGHQDNLSDKSFQEQDMRFGRGIKKEDFNLFFDDIYDAHSQSPPRTSF